MRHPRNFKQNKCYHLTSRVAHRALFLNEEERTRFVDRMWRVAVFSGMTVLAYCIMTNHFHIFVYAPEPVPLSDDELLDRIRTLYRGDRLLEIEKAWDAVKGSPSGREEFRRRFIRRMEDVSEFMKTLKQHTTVSFNCRNSHTGTLWESRFDPREYDPSDKETLATVAAYIDRNPVKAGLVSWPDAYPWCGFAAADKGDRRCIGAYARIYSYVDPCEWKEIRETHGQGIARALWKLLGDVSSERAAELEAFVRGEKRGEALAQVHGKAADSKDAPRLVERGSNEVAFKILAGLKEGPRSPAELRKALGLANANSFTAYYLTPMEASGLIKLAEGCTRFSPKKKFRLTAKGRSIA